MPKRRRHEEGPAEEEEATPRKTRRSARKEEEDAKVASPQVAETPSGRKSILRGTPSKLNGVSDAEPTPKSLRRVLFATPSKPEEQANGGPQEETPTSVRNDRSARRKSQRTLQQQVAANDDSEDEDAAQDEAIAQQILGEEDGSDEDEETDLAEPTSAPDTPSKTGRLRGRPKGKRRERTTSPPPDLPPHELYFFQNRAGANKTSANTLPSHLLLNHDDYFMQINACKDSHAEDIDRLKHLHKRAFDQWVFELEEGFNLCLYGYGSKRQLVMEFAEHLYHQPESKPRIVVVNGYTPGLGIKDVLTTLAGVIFPKSAKLPAQPPALLDALLSHLTDSPSVIPVTVIIHSMDHTNLRKPATQSMLGRLAAHPSISLLPTCDTPNFPLLWDVNLTTQFRFLYHDATTYEPFRVEIDVVAEVNALLGRSRRRLGGKDGVGYVLKSLPENARALFRILVAEQLAMADVEPGATAGAGFGEDTDVDPDDILGAEDEEEAAQQQDTPSRRGRKKKAKKPAPRPAPKPVVSSAPEGVEYRTLYHKAVEEFVCSSELNFRTLLKEFHDHQMIESRKDAAGTERLIVPFRQEELEGILEELV
jgi:origin recognition complex subunit 2